MSGIIYLHSSVSLVSICWNTCSNVRHITESTIRQAMIISTRSRLSGRTNSAPIPVGIATISAAITTRHAMPASSLSPVKISGTASGRMTVVRIFRSDAPSVLAAFVYYVGIHTFDACNRIVEHWKEGTEGYQEDWKHLPSSDPDHQKWCPSKRRYWI